MNRGGCLIPSICPSCKYFVSVFGDAGGFLGLGLFGAKVELKPSSGVVPLAGSALLLSSGLVGLAWLRMRAKK